MGLDMYLSAEVYVSGYSFQNEEKQAAYQSIVSAVGLEDFASPDTPSAYVKVTVAYWRKANAIHAWFVDNVQGGVDECQEAPVSIEALGTLHAACTAALNLYDNGDVEGAGIVMTPRSGFFFGSTDLDEDFANDLRDTIKQIERLLPLGITVQFSYQSSW